MALLDHTTIRQRRIQLILPQINTSARHSIVNRQHVHQRIYPTMMLRPLEDARVSTRRVSDLWRQHAAAVVVALSHQVAIEEVVNHNSSYRLAATAIIIRTTDTSL